MEVSMSNIKTCLIKHEINIPTEIVAIIITTYTYILFLSELTLYIFG